MTNKFADRVQVTTATTGTGDLTLGAAVSGYRTFAGGGVATGSSVRYLLQEGAAWEIGTATYLSAGPTLSGRTLGASSTGSLLSLSGAGVVSVIVGAADLPPPLRFPSTAVADSDPNALDDYAEGTWTPTVAGSTTAGAFTYTKQNGVFTKIGRVVVLHFAIDVSATSVAPTGTVTQITGLPYGAVATNQPGDGVSRMSGITLSASYSSLAANVTSSSVISLQQSGSGVSIANLPASALGASFSCYGTILYHV